MTEFEFRCSECGQEISVNDRMRDAILTNGCPVCTAPTEPSDFEPAADDDPQPPDDHSR